MNLIELSYEIEGSAPILGGGGEFRKWCNDVREYLAPDTRLLKEFNAISFFPSAGIGDVIPADWNEGAWNCARKCISDFASVGAEADNKNNK